jgi:hypothetical protein
MYKIYKLGKKYYLYLDLYRFIFIIITYLLYSLILLIYYIQKCI